MNSLWKSHITTSLTEKKYCDIVVYLRDSETKKLIGEYNLHRFFLCQSDYFQYILNDTWENNNILDIEISNSSWINYFSALKFFTMFYNCDNELMIEKESLDNCISIHKLADFFLFDDLRKLAAKEIIKKIETLDDLYKISEYIKYHNNDTDLEKCVYRWNLFNMTQNKNHDNIIKLNNTETIFIPFIIQLTKEKEIIPKQEKFFISNYNWFISISHDSDNVFPLISLCVTGDESCKLLTNIKIFIVNKMESSSLQIQKILYVNLARSNLFHLENIFSENSFKCNDNTYIETEFFLLPIFIFINVNNVIHPLNLSCQPDQKNMSSNFPYSSSTLESGL